MWDCNNFQRLNLEKSCHRWIELTELETDLIELFRQMPEVERKQIHRIAGYLVRPVEDE
ncbi:hypothetical protein [Pseudomonas congelans]|uniref:hypothetical protein n=1 Tax=Pseudomonas congelans TaxID=200452 RepID=UPI00165641A9|nr:hypothetical protein [Pseudomonas congelans]MBC8801224.1 hypothetical protein [Pseudomonas congelans]